MKQYLIYSNGAIDVCRGDGTTFDSGYVILLEKSGQKWLAKRKKEASPTSRRECDYSKILDVQKIWHQTEKLHSAIDALCNND